MKRILEIDLLSEKEIAAAIEYLDPEMESMAEHPEAVSDGYISHKIETLDPDGEPEGETREPPSTGIWIWMSMLCIYLLFAMAAFVLWHKLLH